MLRQFIFRIILRVSYYHGLVIGLMPAPFNWQRGVFHTSSTCYLLYSAVLQSVLALGAPYSYWNHVHEGKHMGGDRVMQVTNIFSSYSRYFTFLAFSIIIWLRRQALLQLYEQYWQLITRHARVLPTGCTYMLSRRTQRIVVIYFVLAQLAAALRVLATLMFYAKEKLLQQLWEVVSCILSTYVNTPTYYIMLTHCHLCDQFDGINERLERALARLQRHITRCRATKALKAPRALTQELNELAMAHFELFRMTTQVFRFSQVVYALILLKMFNNNLVIVHGATQLLFFKGRAVFALGMLAGCVVVIACAYVTYSSTFEPLQTLLSACNDAGPRLREYNELLQLRNCRVLQQTLNRFADHLRSNKLRYKVCGLFHFDQRSAVTCSFVVLVNFTILMQFDMQFKMEAETNDRKP